MTYFLFSIVKVMQKTQKHKNIRFTFLNKEHDVLITKGDTGIKTLS